jgi:hypothetical protein
MSPRLIIAAHLAGLMLATGVHLLPATLPCCAT